MANAKFVKTAAAVALGASVVTTAVAPGAASAATKYKVNSKGNLVLKSTGSLVKGWVEFGGKLYKNGKPAPAKKYKIMGTGASMKLYFGPTLKKGYKTANSKSLLFKDGKLLKGNKQTADRTRYYENGKLATGWDVVAADETKYIYKSGKLFKEPKTATRDGVLNYFENGKLAEGTKAFKDTLFTDGTVDEKDQVFEDVLYVGGKKAEGTVTFEDVVYIDGVKDTEKPEITAEDKTVEYGSEAVDVATLATVKDNSGEEIKAEAKISFGGKAVEKIDTKTPGVYTVTFTAKDKNGNEAEAKEVKVTVAEAAKAEVESVTAINATQVKVTFNKAVSESAAEAVDASGVSTVVKLGGSTLKTPELSEDGRTLILTTTAAINANNATVEVEPIATKADANVKTVRYASLLTYKDVVAPTVASTEKVNYTTVKVKFSEPVQSQGAWTYKDKDGNTQTATVTGFDGTSVKLAVDPIKVVSGSTVTFTGVNISDVANNLITPNPVSVSFTVGAKDEVAPTVNSITQTGGKKFEITFNKAVSAGTVTVNGAATTVAPKTTGATTDTTFVVTTTTSLNDAQTVAVSGFANADGTSMDAYSKVVAFQKDAVAPKVTDSKLVTVGSTKYAQLTFDKEVTAGSVSVTGSYVKDYVTTAVSGAANAIYPTGDTSRKVLLVPVASFASIDGAKYDLTVSSTAVKNDSDVPMASASVSFTLDSTQDTNTNVFAASDITLKETANPSVITVDFGTYTPDGATATAASNYKVNGQTVKSVKLTDANTAELTLNPGQITVSGTYNVTVSGVKVKDSTKVMDAVTKPVASLSENVAPTIKSTILKDNGTAAVAAAASITGTNAAKVTAGALTGATNSAATTYTVAANGTDVTGGSSAITLDASGKGTFTQGGVTFTIAGAVAGDTFTVATTAAATASGARITLTASENLNTTVAADAFEVYAGSTKLDLAASNAITISGNTITIKLAGAVTSAQLATGLTVKPTANNNVKDSVGNALDIATTGVQVAQ